MPYFNSIVIAATHIDKPKHANAKCFRWENEAWMTKVRLKQD
jgi:hypothetical protein